jgi:hypothetical protein
MALTVTEWAQVVAPFLAFGAAGASWASVALTRKQWKESTQPRLDGYWSDGEDGWVNLRIDNTGAGPALEPRFCVFGENRRAAGRIVRTGPLRPGRSADVYVELPPRPEGADGTGVLACLDLSGAWHVWSWDGRHRKVRNWRLQPPPEVDLGDLLAMMYPETAGWTFQPVEFRSAERTLSEDQE